MSFDREWQHFHVLNMEICLEPAALYSMASISVMILMRCLIAVSGGWNSLLVFFLISGIMKGAVFHVFIFFRRI